MSKKKMSFEEALARIDEVIEALESKGVSLENSISLYEEAASLIKDCHSIISKAEGRVKKIVDKQTKEIGELDV